MFSKSIITGAMLAAILAAPVRAADSQVFTTVVQASDSDSEGADCFYTTDRAKPECQSVVNK